MFISNQAATTQVAAPRT